MNKPAFIGDEWAEQCRYWADRTRQAIPRRKRREKQSRPLILTGHGISVRVDKSTLLIRDGNTHYPNPISEFRYFRGDLNLPNRIILIDGSGNITLDAIDWLAEQDVHIIRLKWIGEVTCLSTPNGYSGNFEKIRWQIETQKNIESRLQFSTQLILRKFKAKLFNLENLLPPSNLQRNAIERTKSAISLLEKEPPENISKLLGLEGGVAASYFYAWKKLPINWRSTSRYPIPDEWLQYASRSALKPKHRNYKAAHPINAMLNYAYKVLETEMKILSVIDGYDPGIGIMHVGKRSSYSNEPSFILDIMEPFRPITDRVIINFVINEKFSGGDFSLTPDGVCRLNPEIARYVAQSTTETLHREGLADWSV